MVNGYNLNPDERKRTIRILQFLALFLCALCAYKLGQFRGLDVPADSPAFENVLQAKLMSFKLLVAIPLIPAVLGMVSVLVYAADRSELGKRFLHWADSDPDQVRAAKTLNLGLLSSFLALGLFGVLSAALR